MPKRKSCRKCYKELRDVLSEEHVLAKSQQICRQVLLSDEYKNAETIFAYYPLGNEVDCLMVMKQALKDGKRIVLPRTTYDCQMDFYEIKSLVDVEEGHFHVMEPKSECEKFVPEQNDVGDEESAKCLNALVLVPGVVFDFFGNRYGYGKGYYDRYFARFPQLVRIALAYTEQLSEEPLECSETDMKMHMIVTQDEVIRVD